MGLSSGQKPGSSCFQPPLGAGLVREVVLLEARPVGNGGPGEQGLPLQCVSDALVRD